MGKRWEEADHICLFCSRCLLLNSVGGRTLGYNFLLYIKKKKKRQLRKQPTKTSVSKYFYNATWRGCKPQRTGNGSTAGFLQIEKRPEVDTSQRTLNGVQVCTILYFYYFQRLICPDFATCIHTLVLRTIRKKGGKWFGVCQFTSREAPNTKGESQATYFTTIT